MAACSLDGARPWTVESARTFPGGIRVLGAFGPNLGRPSVDSLKASKHANMKELRFAWEGEVWRIAFAFDPLRQAILLVGGDKSGADQPRFYQRLIRVADARFDEHLAELKQSRKERKHGKTTG